MSLAACAMWDALGFPTAKAPINAATFVSYVLPPALFYFAMAVLVVTPRTRALRVALWPVVTSLALRAAFSVDIVLSNFGQEFHVGLEVSGSFGRPLIPKFTHQGKDLNS